MRKSKYFSGCLLKPKNSKYSVGDVIEFYNNEKEIQSNSVPLQVKQVVK